MATTPRSMRSAHPVRTARPRHYVMCPPEYFDVTYAINPWMHPDVTVDTDRARQQWETLHATYLELGHRVDLLDPEPGLPDMVFAANGGLVVDGRAMGARFHYAERQAEAPAHLKWLAAAGLDPVVEPLHVNEGEGDFLVVGSRILAGTGFRSEPAAHDEVAEFTGHEVVPLGLVDPRYYHLDTAIAVLGDDDVAYLPSAFDDDANATLRRLYPDAVIASEADAAVLGLNAVSDGANVVIAPQATGLIEAVAARGYTPVPVDTSELLLAGGGIKCCTMEVRERPFGVPARAGQTKEAS